MRVLNAASAVVVAAASVGLLLAGHEAGRRLAVEQVRPEVLPPVVVAPAARSVPAAPAVGARVGVLSSPALPGWRVPVVEGIGPAELSAAAGHYPGSALPGQLGNMVVAGHRVTHTHPFRHLDRLRPGDGLAVATPNGTHAYRVLWVRVVDPRRGGRVLGDLPGRNLTLTTCHPPGSARQRLIVRAVLVP